MNGIRRKMREEFVGYDAEEEVITRRRKAIQSSNDFSILPTSISHLALTAETAMPELRVCWIA